MDMNEHMHEHEHQNEKYYSREFSFNIIEFIKYFYDHKGMIILSMIAMALIGYFISMKFFPPTRSASLETEISFKGIENGKNPDGTTFSPSQLISPAIIEKTNQDMNTLLKTQKFHNMAPYIGIEPVIPWLVKNKMAQAEKNKQEFVYHPVTWKLTFVVKQNNVNQFSSLEMMRYLEELIANYKSDYIIRYGRAQIAAIASIEQMTKSSLEPLGKLIFLGNYSSSLIKNFKTVIPSSGYVSMKSGMSFNMIEESLANLQMNTIPKLTVAATRLMVVGSPDIYVLELEQQYQSMQLKMKIAAAEAAAVEKLLSGIQKNNASSNANNNNLSGVEIKFDNSMIDFIKKSDAQLLLIQKAMTARMEEGQAGIESENILRLIKEFTASKASNEKQKNATELNKNIDSIIQEVFYLSHLANQLYGEYMSQSSNDVITITERFEATTQYKITLAIIMGMILVPIVLTAFLAFVNQLINKCA